MAKETPNTEKIKSAIKFIGILLWALVIVILLFLIVEIVISPILYGNGILSGLLETGIIIIFITLLVIAIPLVYFMRKPKSYNKKDVLFTFLASVIGLICGVIIPSFLILPIYPGFICPSYLNNPITFILGQLILLMVAIIILCIGYIKLNQKQTKYLTAFVLSFIIMIFILSILGVFCPTYL